MDETVELEVLATEAASATISETRERRHQRRRPKRGTSCHKPPVPTSGRIRESLLTVLGKLVGQRHSSEVPESPGVANLNDVTSEPRKPSSPSTPECLRGFLGIGELMSFLHPFLCIYRNSVHKYKQDLIKNMHLLDFSYFFF